MERQLELKDEGIGNLQMANEQYREKCSFLENELQQKLVDFD